LDHLIPVSQWEVQMPSIYSSFILQSPDDMTILKTTQDPTDDAAPNSKNLSRSSISLANAETLDASELAELQSDQPYPGGGAHHVVVEV
jgi:hypothetical protein